MGDHNSFHARFVGLRKSIMLDGMAQSGVPFDDKTLSVLSSRIEHEGISFVQVTLPLLGKALDRGLISGVFEAPASFSRLKNSALPKFLGSAFGRIFDTRGLLRPDACVYTIGYVRQFLLLDSKLEIPYRQELNDLRMRKFCDQQLNLSFVAFPRSSPVVDEATRLITHIFSKFPSYYPVPQHGPGAVYEGYDRDEKWVFGTWPKKAERHFPYYLYGALGLSDVVRNSPVRLVDSTTRACFVPKDFRGPRLISIEHTAMQYLQQGMMLKLYAYLKTVPLLTASVRLEDQGVNRRAAATAWSESFATLDLSDASDTLSAVCVWNLFSGVPTLRRQLFSLRSDYVEFPQHKQRLYAFSPMGSAICFPIETICFYSLALACAKVIYPSTRLRELASLVKVFGDDIIVPMGPIQQLLSHTLHSIGCKVNESKTCYLTPFRESCGGEWYADMDVTIIRNKHFRYTQDLVLADHPVLRSLQRKFFLRGYHNTASLLLQWCREIYPTVVLRPSDFSQKEEFDFAAYGSETDVPIWRFNKDYQRIEAKIPSYFQCTRKWLDSLSSGRLRARLIGDSTEGISHSRRKTKLRWQSVPFYAGVSQLRPV